MKVKSFLKKNHYDCSEDFNLQIQYWAYVIAKHYNISLLEVYNMPKAIFQQSLIWAMAVNDETSKEREIQTQKAKANGREVVPLDYSFLDKDGF